MASRHEVERVQRAALAQLLREVSAVDGRVNPRWDWEAYACHQPVTGWQDWAGQVERQRRSGQRLLSASPVQRYQPTSGSTSAIKWVPYTRRFLAELDAAIAPWLGDLYTRYPGLRTGRHYWSLSWLPTDLRGAQAGELNDDMTLLSVGKRVLARLTQAVPRQVALAPTPDDAMFATLAWLAADEGLSALSVWSPSFALNLVERLGERREVLAEVLDSGRWGGESGAAGPCPRSRRAAALLRAWDGRPDAGFLAQLWPRLALVSAWDTGASAPWADRLRRLFPAVAFQGKGLWATEGVVSIPFRDRTLLAYRSHVYEFEDLHDGRLLAPWQLRTGQDVCVLLSTGSGLLRYRMSDVVRVEGHWGGVPCLRFLGREDSTDLVGEKVSSALALAVLDDVTRGSGLPAVSLLALDDAGAGRPGYVLLLERSAGESGTAARVEMLAQRLEQCLSRHFHYRLARELGQLDAARILCMVDARQLYAEQCCARGMVEGNVKIEPLRHWPALPPRLQCRGVTTALPPLLAVAS